MATAATLSSPQHHFTSPSQTPHEHSTSTDDNPATRPITSIPSGPISSTITYYAAPPDGSAPYNYVSSPPPGTPQRNYGADTRTVRISDARGHESDFSTDAHGFALVQGQAEQPLLHGQAVDWDDDAQVSAAYYPEVEALLRSHLRAERVLIFDHTVRRAAKGAARGPVNRAHVDQTVRAGRERVRRHVPDEREAEALLGGRCRIVNVWRPLNGPVVAQPLAMAESDSLPAEGLVPVEHRYPDRTGQTAGVAFTEGQRWWYWSGMGNGERILLQCWDSETGKRTPHTAFEDPRTQGPQWRGRESIEVRALVFG